MPRKKQETGLSESGLPLDLTKSDTIWSVNMAAKTGDLITMLSSLDTPVVRLECHVTQRNGKNVARLVILSEIPGLVGTFMSALWALNLPNTSQDTSQKK